MVLTCLHNCWCLNSTRLTLTHKLAYNCELEDNWMSLQNDDYFPYTCLKWQCFSVFVNKTPNATALLTVCSRKHLHQVVALHCTCASNISLTSSCSTWLHRCICKGDKQCSFESQPHSSQHKQDNKPENMKKFVIASLQWAQLWRAYWVESSSNMGNSVPPFFTQF